MKTGGSSAIQQPGSSKRPSIVSKPQTCDKRTQAPTKASQYTGTGLHDRALNGTAARFCIIRSSTDRFCEGIWIRFATGIFPGPKRPCPHSLYLTKQPDSRRESLKVPSYSTLNQLYDVRTSIIQSNKTFPYSATPIRVWPCRKFLDSMPAALRCDDVRDCYQLMPTGYVTTTIESIQGEFLPAANNKPHNGPRTTQPIPVKPRPPRIPVGVCLP